MRKAFVPFLLIFFVVGCAGSNSPDARLAQAKLAYSQTLNAVVALHQDGKISDEVFVDKVEPIRAATKAAIDEAELAVAAGDPRIEAYLEAVLRNIDKLAALEEAFQ